MRSRVEDLGRLSVLIKNLTDHKIFSEEIRGRGAKQYFDHFSRLTDINKEETIILLINCMADLKHKLNYMLEIAEGMDYLNKGIKNEY